MNHYKWRLIFSSASVILALWLAHTAHQEYSVAHQLHPGFRLSGKYGYMVTAVGVSYSLNAPALFLSDLASNSLVRELGWERSYSRYGPVDYYASIFVFWWLVGWKFDSQLSPRMLAKATLIAGCSVGLLLSILFLILAESGQQGSTVQIASAVWGLGLLYYFVKSLRDKRW
jgi:hypothetical protein